MNAVCAILDAQDREDTLHLYKRLALDSEQSWEAARTATAAIRQRFKQKLLEDANRFADAKADVGMFKMSCHRLIALYREQLAAATRAKSEREPWKDAQFGAFLLECVGFYAEIIEWVAFQVEDAQPQQPASIRTLLSRLLLNLGDLYRYLEGHTESRRFVCSQAMYRRSWRANRTSGIPLNQLSVVMGHVENYFDCLFYGFKSMLCVEPFVLAHENIQSKIDCCIGAKSAWRCNPPSAYASVKDVFLWHFLCEKPAITSVIDAWTERQVLEGDATAIWLLVLCFEMFVGARFVPAAMAPPSAIASKPLLSFSFGSERFLESVVGRIVQKFSDVSANLGAFCCDVQRAFAQRSMLRPSCAKSRAKRSFASAADAQWRAKIAAGIEEMPLFAAIVEPLLRSSEQPFVKMIVDGDDSDDDSLREVYCYKNN